MRVIIVPADGFVSVDGEDYREVDLSFVAPNIHAVQWYGTFGEVELVDDYGRAVANEPITSIEPYDLAITRWQEAKLKALNDVFPATPVVEEPL